MRERKVLSGAAPRAGVPSPVLGITPGRARPDPRGHGAGLDPPSPQLGSPRTPRAVSGDAHVHDVGPRQERREGGGAADGPGPAGRQGAEGLDHRAADQDPAWPPRLEQGEGWPCPAPLPKPRRRAGSRVPRTRSLRGTPWEGPVPEREDALGYLGQEQAVPPPPLLLSLCPRCSGRWRRRREGKSRSSSAARRRLPKSSGRTASTSASASSKKTSNRWPLPRCPPLPALTQADGLQRPDPAAPPVLGQSWGGWDARPGRG